MVETAFTLTLRDMYSAVRLSGLTAYFRLRALICIPLAILAIMLGVVILIQPGWHRLPAFVFMPGIIGAVVLYPLLGALLYWVLWPRAARRQMRASRELTGPVQCRGDDAGWHVRTPLSASDTHWAAYTKWAENADMLLVYINSTTFQMIPKRALTGPHDLGHIRAWLTQAGVPRVAPFAGYWRSRP